MRVLNSTLFVDRLICRYSVFCALKIAALVFISVLFFYTSAFAYQLNLEWDSNVEQDLAGYIVYYGTTSRDYDYDVDVGDETSCTISNLYSGNTYYFAVTAYDIDGNESPYSEEITYPNSGGASSSGGGGGGGGCFILTVAEGQTMLGSFLAFFGLVFAGILGYLLHHRKSGEG